MSCLTPFCSATVFLACALTSTRYVLEVAESVLWLEFEALSFQNVRFVHECTVCYSDKYLVWGIPEGPINSPHSWCFTHKLRGGGAGFRYFWLQPRHTWIFTVIKVRVKGLVSDDVVGVVQCINGGGATGIAISDGWMLTFVAFIIKLPGDSDDSALPIDKGCSFGVKTVKALA